MGTEIKGKAHILLVEDDGMIASGIAYALEMEGYEVCHARCLAEAYGYLNVRKFELALLDMQLPDGKGSELGELLKSAGTALIFLTAADDENTIVKAFDDGASDYVVKPFRIRELLARVRRTLAGQNPQTDMGNILRAGRVKINTDEAKVFAEDQAIELTALEYRLLLIFANHPGRLLSRQEILDKIWDMDGNFVEDNTLTVYVKRLRGKLGNALKIETVRGMGYRVD